jgi:hypothetical protein
MSDREAARRDLLERTLPQANPLKARVHPHWAGGRAGYVYSIIYDGELLVDRSPAPEGDAARALLARGITGRLTLLDGKTGRPRIAFNSEKMARLCAKEGPLRFAPYVSRPNRPCAGEGPLSGITIPERADEALNEDAA